MGIFSYKNKGTKDIACGIKSKESMRLLPLTLHELAHLKCLRLDAAVNLEDLRMFPSSKLEKLKGNRAGQYSIRINQKYRICFNWKAPDASNVEIVDYH